jgi:hypothetical protein
MPLVESALALAVMAPRNFAKPLRVENPFQTP